MLEAGDVKWYHSFTSFSQLMSLGKTGKALVTFISQMKIQRPREIF